MMKNVSEVNINTVVAVNVHHPNDLKEKKKAWIHLGYLKEPLLLIKIHSLLLYKCVH